jgi:predicted transcriptional regulator
MLRTTVYLDEDIALALRQLAERQDRPQAEIIRDALGK